MRRLILAAVLVVVLTGCAHRLPFTAYCYAEGGQPPTCVSQGSRGGQ